MQQGPLAQRESNRYRQTVQEYSEQLGHDWLIADRPTRLLTWRLFRHRSSPLPSQSWKIHVSASAPEAVTLLHAVVPTLFALEASFKLPLDLQGILYLNWGMLGITQMGKVVTIYPHSEDHCRAIVGKLQRLWPHSQGPLVPSDFAVLNCSAISLRFGAFALGQTLLDELGRPYTAVKSPDGSLIRDTRTTLPQKPSWAPAPPVSVVTDAQPKNPFSEDDHSFYLGDKHYIAALRLSHSIRGTVLLAVRTDKLQSVIIKTAPKRVGTDLRGYDAADRVKNEFDILRQLERRVGVAPRPIALHESDVWSWGPAPPVSVVTAAQPKTTLVLEDVGGVPIEDLDLPERVRSLTPLAAAVAGLHEAGIVHRDVKLGNAVRTKDGAVRLIDFGLAAPVGLEFGILGGTPGHTPPESSEASADGAQDVYALGACIAHAFLGRNPGLLPVPNNAGRLLGFLDLVGARRTSQLVRLCTKSDPRERPTAAQVENLIRSSEGTLLQDLKQKQQTSPGPPDSKWIWRAATQAGLATKSFIRQMDSGHCWRNAHHHPDYELEAINIGAAGVILGLLSIDTACRSFRFSSDIAGGCKWLAGNQPASVAHGLFTGNAGVALALATAGVRLGDQRLQEASRKRLLAAVRGPTEDYDLFSGAAGIVFAGCLMSLLLQHDWPLDAVAHKAQSIADGHRVVDGVICWPSSALYDSTQVPYFGAAHGASGVAMALAVWASAASQPRLLPLAANVFSTIFAGARSPDGTSIVESVHGRVRPPSHWCHGVGGYLWCLLQAFRDSTELQVEKEWAAETFLRHATPVDNPTFCHGLAGNLGLLRLLTSIERYRSQASACISDTVQALRLLHHRAQGLTVWSSENPSDVTPDLWVGFLGPATELALYAAGHSEALLSGDWLVQASRPPNQPIELEPALRPTARPQYFGAAHTRNARA